MDHKSGSALDISVIHSFIKININIPPLIKSIVSLSMSDNDLAVLIMLSYYFNVIW